MPVTGLIRKRRFDMNNIIKRNIDALCKMHDKNKSEVDECLGHHQGYLAKKNGMDLTWEQLTKIAEFFGITIVDLTTHDFTREAEITYLVNKIQQTEDELIELRKSLEILKGIEEITKGA